MTSYFKLNSFKKSMFGFTGASLLFASAMVAASPAGAVNHSLTKQNQMSAPIGIMQLQSDNWWENGADDPVIHIIVEKISQIASVYSNGILIEQSKVSTGKAGHETPGGIFSILSKSRMHRSNIYSNAPMPFMQRLTWSGIALHQSNSVPDYPASHGCIRLPGKFAGELFKFTHRGAQVFVTGTNARPQRFSSPNMFTLGNESVHEASLLRPSNEVVSNITQSKPADAAKPLRVLLTRNTGRQRLIEIQSILSELHYYDGNVDGWMGPQTGKAILAFQKDYHHKVTGSLTKSLLAELYRATGRGKPKNGHIYVRRNHKSIFDVAVVLEREDVPLGTHHFAAVFGKSEELKASQPSFWLSTSIEPTGWNEKGKDNINIASDAEEAIERFIIPDDVKRRISSMLTMGSTVIIADKGFSRETTSETDFIILTKNSTQLSDD